MTIGFGFYNNLGEADMLVTSTGALAEGDPLFTSAVECLFTRRQAEAVTGAALPNVAQGWYGDTFRKRPLGSRLWTLRDAKLDTETLRLAQLYAFEALSWWLPRIVKTLEVTTAEVARYRFSLTIKTTRPDGGPWGHVWQEVALSGL
jgi:phage gp46-like protein